MSFIKSVVTDDIKKVLDKVVTGKILLIYGKNKTITTQATNIILGNTFGLFDKFEVTDIFYKDLEGHIQKYGKGGFDIVLMLDYDPDMDTNKIYSLCIAGGYIVIAVNKCTMVNDYSIKKFEDAHCEHYPKYDSYTFVIRKNKFYTDLLDKKVAMICPVDDHPLRKIDRPKTPAHSWTEYIKIVPLDGFYGVPSHRHYNELSKYDIIIVVSFINYASSIISMLKTWFPEKKIGLYADSYLLSMFNAGEGNWPIAEFLHNAKFCDFYAYNRPDGDRFWKSFVPEHSDRSVFLSFPIDVGYIRKNYCSKNVDNSVFVAGDHLCSSSVAFVEKNSPGSIIKMVDYRIGNQRPQIEQFKIHKEIFPKVSQDEFYRIISNSKFCVYFDTKGSVGRIPRDMAALRIPCVGFSCTGYQQQLFPSMTIENLTELGRLANRLHTLEKEIIREDVLSVSDKWIKEYDIEESIKRFYKFVEFVTNL